VTDPRPDRERAEAPPLQLEYFAAHEPDRTRVRGVTTWSIVLLASWAPYLCGIVNAAAVARSYVPDVTSAHLNGTILFMGLGLIMAAACFARFIALRHVAGSIASGVVVIVQLTLATCLGLAR
jgi:hypothetical protein